MLTFYLGKEDRTRIPSAQLLLVHSGKYKCTVEILQLYLQSIQ